MTRLGRPPTANADRRVSIRIPEEVHRQVEVIAREQGWSFSRAARACLSMGALSMLLELDEEAPAT